jgi:Lipocalin-like domain
MKNSIIGLFALLFFAACQEEDQSALIVGQWNASSWTVNGQETDRDEAGVSFTFNADKSYKAAYGAQSESGTFNLKGNKLYTTAENKIEKMVEVTRKGTDTLVMNMNRVGTAETITLVKK